MSIGYRGLTTSMAYRHVCCKNQSIFNTVGKVGKPTDSRVIVNNFRFSSSAVQSSLYIPSLSFSPAYGPFPRLDRLRVWFSGLVLLFFFIFFFF